MKRMNLKPYAALLVLVALFSACSGPPESSSATNSSVPQQANSNSASQDQVAQGNTSAAPSPAAPSPAPPAVGPPPPPVPQAKSAANINAVVPKATTSSNSRAPKLVVPAKKIDYGKQPQEKTLVRAIVIRNGGLADLNIESVVPS